MNASFQISTGGGGCIYSILARLGGGVYLRGAFILLGYKFGNALLLGMRMSATIFSGLPRVLPVLMKSHWLPVYYLILFKVLLLVFKSLNGLAPHYVSDLLNKRVSVRSLRSYSQELLNIPRSRTKTYGDRAFSVAGPRLWNE